MPALPVLGAAAKFLMSNGARAATMKFGKAAVDKAKDQIKKRDAAIGDKASKANIGVKEPKNQNLREKCRTQNAIRRWLKKRQLDVVENQTCLGHQKTKYH